MAYELELAGLVRLLEASGIAALRSERGPDAPFILCGGPLTGAAMNPARAFGPQLVANFWESYAWIYYAGPAVGAVVAALLYELLFLRDPVRPVGPKETGVLEPRPGDLAES